MNIKQLLMRFVFPHSYSREAYIKYLRNHKVIIGDNVTIYQPNHVTIDIRKPYMVKIGNYCKITRDVTILAHDYGVSVPRRVYGLYVGGGKPVTIGDNVFIGMGSIILMGTTIGNNCIVGANSVVKGSFPDNVVIAGNPARIICSLEDYYQRNLDSWIDDAKLCARTIFERTGKNPTIEEMTDGYAWLYLSRTQENVDKYQHFFNLTSDDYEDVVENFMKSKPVYTSFDEFLEDCGLETH